MFDIEYTLLTYLVVTINDNVVSCLFQGRGEKNHN